MNSQEARTPSRVRSFARLALVNVAVLAGLLALIELALGDWFGPLPLNGEETQCPDPVLHHVYCPEMLLRRYMAKSDGGATVDTYINKSRLAVASASQMSSTTAAVDYDVINLGDSFMEAEELPFADRISQQMRDLGRNALGVGYTSWAPYTMLAWLRQNPLKPGEHVNLFVMTNDFMPHYPWANINYHKLLHRTEDGKESFDLPAKPPIDHSLTGVLSRRSFIVSRLDQIMRARRVDSGRPAEAPFQETSFAYMRPGCDDLDEQLERKDLPVLLKDILPFARAESCWDEDTRAAVASGIEDIGRIEELVSSQEARLTVLLVPGGWAFPDETLGGKSLVDWWGMGREATLTQAGLAAHLAGQLKGIDYVDLEPVIRALKQSSDGDAWYFDYDGHWTALAHRELAGWLASRP